MSRTTTPLSPTLCVLFVTFLWLVLFFGRLMGPATLTDDDQERPAAYIIDALRNGNWIVQVDETGDVTSKPPLYTWLAATASLAWGQLDRFTLYLPSGLAVLGVAWLVLAVGWRHFSPAAGLIAACVFLVSLPNIMLLNLARTDPVFVFLTIASALLLWRLWETGRGAFWFWLVVALATLTKGPLGLVLALGGLFAIAWERWRPGTGPRPAGVLSQPLMHILGIALYIALNLGWLLLAQSQLGDAVTDKLIGKELAGHATGARAGGIPGEKFYQPTPIFILRFLPWSIPALFGIWMIFRFPNSNPTVRRLERFLVAYTLFALLIFSISPHQRHLHLAPLYFTMALFAGRVLAVWIANRGWNINSWKAATATLLFTVVFIGGYNTSRMLTQRRDNTLEYFEMSTRARQAFGSSINVANLDASFSFQFKENTHIPRINNWRARSLFASSEPAFVAISDWRNFIDSYEDNEPPTLYRFGVTEDAEFGTDAVEIVSTHPRLELPDSHATYVGEIRIAMHGVTLLEAGPLNHLRFHATRPQGRIRVVNDTDPERTLHFTIINADDDSPQSIVLPKWQWRDIEFTAARHSTILPPPPQPSWPRRGIFLLAIAALVTAGGAITRRSLTNDDASP